MITFKERGYSLIELAISMGVIALLTSAIVPVAVRAIELKAAEKTVVEIGIVQKAAQKYYAENHVWPSDLATLQTLGYLSPLWSLNNPWKNPYLANFNSKTMTVLTQVPDNLSDMLTLRLPQSSKEGNVIKTVIGSSDNNFIPAGVITAWSGMIVDIPLGWVLCDGDNGTPDLRDKFIVGAREDNNDESQTNVTGILSKFGGNVSHNHSGFTESHTLTINEIPSHDHAENPDVSIDLINSKGLYGSNPGGHASMFSPLPRTGKTGGSQGHRHGISSDVHVPPFYALAFIMKI